MSSLVLPVLTLALAGAPQNDVLAQLTGQGLRADAAGKSFVKLGPPTMLDGLDAAAQRRKIEEVAGPKRRVEDLLHDAVVAPFVLKIEDVPAPGAADPFRRMDVWYVAYGKLESFLDEDFFESLVDMGREAKKGRLPATKKVLRDDALRQRRIEAADREDRKERYIHGKFPLLDRVLLQATRRVVVTRTAESVIVAAVIDPRFTEDPEYPNTWRSILTDQRGQHSYGPSQPYVASGSYTKITRLQEPAGALFIEYHQLFAEPEGWFGGKNLLRSKLPLAVQDNVRALRRQLKAAGE